MWRAQIRLRQARLEHYNLRIGGAVIPYLMEIPIAVGFD
jgi:hypothetical protein